MSSTVNENDGWTIFGPFQRLERDTVANSSVHGERPWKTRENGALRGTRARDNGVNRLVVHVIGSLGDACHESNADARIH